MIATEEADTRSRRAGDRPRPGQSPPPVDYPPPPGLANRAVADLKRAIGAHPLIALTTAVTVGVLLGCLVKRR